MTNIVSDYQGGAIEETIEVYELNTIAIVTNICDLTQVGHHRDT